MKVLPIASLLIALAPIASADLIVGQVVDSQGIGVAGVDIDVKNLLGSDPVILNDGTDAGGFFATTLPAGLYRIFFFPPPPPAAKGLVVRLEDVVVLGTTNLGVITLPAAIAVTGTVLNPGGVPVFNLDLDVIDKVAGGAITVPGDQTDVFGNFSVAVPPNLIEFRFDTSTVATQTLAPLALDLDSTTDINLGTIVLDPGLRISGVVQTTGGLPVVNADLDVHDPASGDTLYTPQDNTDAFGAFSVVVKAGTWDVEVCPMFADQLVAKAIAGVVVSADVSLGTAVLQPGFQLSGTVTAFDGTAVANADVNVEDAVTGVEVTLCGDNTSAAGTYVVLVPAGTFDVKFKPAGFTQPLGSNTVFDVNVAGATLVNGVLPSCPLPTNYGAGGPGSGGIVPHLTSSGGTPRVSNGNFALELQSGVGGAPAVMIVGFGQGSFPLFGGTLLIDILGPVLTFPLVLSGSAGLPGAGAATFSLPVADDFAGVTIFTQFAVIDFGAATGIVLSDGLQAGFCD